MTKNTARWTSNVVRLWFGCMAIATAPVAVQAQTYYYYPSYVTLPPTAPAGATVAPTYYYVQPTYQYQVARTRYAPQYYQMVYAPQYYQQAQAPQYYQQAPTAQYYQTGYQTQATQASVDTQVVKTADVQVVKTADVQVVKTAGIQVVKTPDAQVATTTAAPVVAESGDPYGFTAWLNSTRAAYGLPAVGHDPNLSSWAAENNNHQAARGIGHYVMGAARRQNSAMGDFANIGAMWMNSPAHRAALLDPTIRSIGIAGLGAYWTFNAN
jgi:uncharacterized protein YkwD